ncbi:MAG TPA: MMPL family transporter [Thermoanaerobaculia bacterium]
MTVRFWERLAQRSIDRPRRALAIMAAVTLLAAPGILRLELRTDGHALVPPDDPAVHMDTEVREHFGLRDPMFIVVVTDHPAGIYNAGTLERVAGLTAELAAIDGIGSREVISLATESRERLDPGTGISFRAFLDPLPETAEDMALLRQDLARPSAAILHGTVLSADRRAAAVVVGVPGSPGRSGDSDRGAVVRQILDVARRFESPHDRVLVVGAPAAEVLLGGHILEDLVLLLPLALLVMAVVLWLGCRRVWGVALGLIEVGAALVWTFGVMGWMGVPVYLTTAMLPVLLTTLGLADEIHVFWHYQRRLASATAGGPHPAAVRETMRQMTRPVVLTTLTTAIGFFSFAPSGVLPVFWVGLFTGLGVLFCMVWSLTVIPAALTLLPPERMTRPAWRHGSGADRAGWTARLVLPLWRRKGPVLAALVLISIAAAAGVSRLFVYDSWIESFAPGSRFRRAMEEVDRLLYGTHILQAELRFSPGPAGPPRAWSRQGPLLDPAAVDAVGGFEEFARRQPGVGGVLGLHSQLSALSHFWGMASPGRVLPVDTYDMDTLLRRFDLSLGLSRRREVVDDALERTVVTVFVRGANYWQTARLMRALRGYEARHLAPRSGRLRFAGDLAVSQAMIPAIVLSQIASVLLSLLGAVTILCLVQGSLRWGLLASLPVVVSVLWVFGFMGFAGIPLGVATSMFCAITLGTGVDFAVHLVNRFHHAQAEPFARARAALEETGPAIVTNTLLTALGFGVLAFSQVPANARLGLLVAAALVASCVLTLLGLGPLLAGISGSARQGKMLN